MLGNVISAVSGTSAIEVSLVSNNGFWLLADDEELFILCGFSMV